MALGMEVGLGPGHIVLDGEPAPSPKKEAEPPNFGPFLLSPNGWMNHDGTCMEMDLGPSHIVLDGAQAPFPPKGGRPPVFGPFTFTFAICYRLSVCRLSVCCP